MQDDMQQQTWEQCMHDDKPGVLALEGSCIGDDVARWRLVGEVHSSHPLYASHKLACTPCMQVSPWAGSFVLALSAAS